MLHLLESLNYNLPSLAEMQKLIFSKTNYLLCYRVAKGYSKQIPETLNENVGLCTKENNYLLNEINNLILNELLLEINCQYLIHINVWQNNSVMLIW